MSRRDEPRSLWIWFLGTIPSPYNNKSWPGFFVVLALILPLLPFVFTYRLIAEIAKAFTGTKDKSISFSKSEPLAHELETLIDSYPSQKEFVEGVLTRVALSVDGNPCQPVMQGVVRFIEELYTSIVPATLPPQPDERDTIAAARWRDNMRATIEQLRAEDACFRIERFAAEYVVRYLKCLPASAFYSEPGISVRIVDAVDDQTTLFDMLYWTPWMDEIEQDLLFRPLRRKLQANMAAASNVENVPKNHDHFTPIERYNGDKADYLIGTPMLHLLNVSVPFSLPEVVRFEHQLMVAGSGHGKSQTFQYMIAEDFDALSRGERSIIVIDSQGDLIRNIQQLHIFAQGEPLDGRLCVIDPTDIEYPAALNLFDMGVQRLHTYSELDRERLTNSIVEMYDFVLGSLLDAEMTQKQGMLFRYITRLLMQIPRANIQTFRELLEPNGLDAYREHVSKLSGTARAFFEQEYDTDQYKRTKQEVLRRLYGLLENRTFERMFSHHRCKVDLFSEMQAGKVILINTAKDLLKQDGTEIFGRFFIAMIAQAAQERATLPQHDRLPCITYIDEFGDYARGQDTHISTVFEQARKYNVGFCVATQYLGQIDPSLQQSVFANTSIKFAGGVTDSDAKTLAGMMRCDPDFLKTQDKGSFAAYIRNVTPRAISMRFPFGHLERFGVMSDRRMAAITAMNREKYAVHYKETQQEYVPEQPVPLTDKKPDYSDAPSENW